MYSFKGRVRYSEVDSEKNMTIPALVDYLQDTCTFQSEDMGYGIDYLARNHVAWVLSSWEIVFEKMPRFMDEIEVDTWPYDFKNFYGYRNFTICNENGETMAIANSVWVFMDIETMRPTKITDEIVNAYIGTRREQISYDWGERKIKYQGEGMAMGPVVVQQSHIDTNHHVNNGKYIQIAQEYIESGFKADKIRVEYKKAATLGDVMYPIIYKEENAITVELSDEAGKPYAVVQFKRNEICLN